ncbi:MAG: iron ABC transporter permease [Sedimentisphaerales bacterium]|nr:iron ABC transporter permease [Sedimentisphaerales bacterium]
MNDLLTPKRLIIRLLLCLALLFVVMFVCSLIGTQKVSLRAVLSGPGSEPGQNTDYDIFVRVRIPRIILAALVGAALAASGVALQAILRNPLAEPYILGISSGAALGVITCVMLGAGITTSVKLGVFEANVSVSVFAFLFALGTVWLVWLIGHLAGGSGITSLLLAGVVVNAFFSALIMLLTSLLDSEKLRSTIFWLMGNITEKDFSTLMVSAIFIVAGILGLFTISQKLNVLTFGVHEAQSLGVNPRAITFAAFVMASFITAVAVGLSGLVGFVGLIIPHCVRLVLGPDHRQLLPASAIVGAAFVVFCDTIARVIMAPEQFPVGVITAIIGGPVFLFLLARYSKKIGYQR